ncbi:MAG: SRPBCC domain-containing protein [Dermatophilus congolensis]|nr:SRPBCC domain-containing protein [Dermatophilus congolensis]
MSIQNEIAEDTEAQDYVEVEARVAKPLMQVWDSLTRPDGIEALFGEGVTLGDKGDPWHGTDGTYGVTRSYHPGEQVRISWHADDNAPATLVDVRFREDGDATVVSIRHEHLPEDADRAALKARWEEGLDRLAALRAQS